MSQIVYISIGIAITANFILLAVVFFNLKKQKIKNTELVNQQDFFSREIKILKHEISELNASSIGMGKMLKQLEQAILQLDSRQEELELQDPESKLYNRASKMAEKGASIEDIMHECEISSAEAQLIVSLRKTR